MIPINLRAVQKLMNEVVERMCGPADPETKAIIDKMNEKNLQAMADAGLGVLPKKEKGK